MDECSVLWVETKHKNFTKPGGGLGGREKKEFREEAT